jgi:hypothetical protein
MTRCSKWSGRRAVSARRQACASASPLSLALALVHVYRDILRHEATHEELYGLHNTRDPHITILIGRASQLNDQDARVLHELNCSLHQVEVVPFDMLGRRTRAVLDNVKRYLVIADAADRRRRGGLTTYCRKREPSSCSRGQRKGRSKPGRPVLAPSERLASAGCVELGRGALAGVVLAIRAQTRTGAVADELHVPYRRQVLAAASRADSSVAP